MVKKTQNPDAFCVDSAVIVKGSGLGYCVKETTETFAGCEVTTYKIRIPHLNMTCSILTTKWNESVRNVCTTKEVDEALSVLTKTKQLGNVHAVQKQKMVTATLQAGNLLKICKLLSYLYGGSSRLGGGHIFSSDYLKGLKIAVSEIAHVKGWTQEHTESYMEHILKEKEIPESIS